MRIRPMLVLFGCAASLLAAVPIVGAPAGAGESRGVGAPRVLHVTVAGPGSTVGTQGHCYYVSWGDGVHIRFNVGAGAPGYGLHVFDQMRQTNDFRRTITEMLIEGNVLFGSTQRSGLILAMGDEGGLDNEIRGIRVRRNLLTGNNHLGMVVGANVRDVVISANRFVENGRQGLHITDDASIRNVDIVGNGFVQTDNDVCTSNCSWYEVLPYFVGDAAVDVTVRN